MGIVFRSDVQIPADSPDHRQIMGLATAYWQSQAVYALARTGIADALSDIPAPVAEIAATVDCDELSVARLLRYLAGLGVVRQDGDKYASTTKTSPLQSGSSFRELVLMFGDEFYRAWANFSSTIRTGRSSYHETYGVELFEFLGANPERAQRFDIAMEATTGLIAEQLARTVDFSETRLVIDVGGGNGALVEAILRSSPATSGLVVDRKQVVANSAARFAGTDLGDRFTAVSGDFFESVPAGGDTYILSRIMHDWLDDDCDRILRVCRSVIPSGVPLLILERELPDEPRPALASSFDLLMMAVTGGRERTRTQFAALLESAGFRLDTTRPLPFETTLLVAYPA